MAGLAALQEWMQAAMLDASGRDARTHVRGDNRLTAEDRIAIYAQGYRQRLIECLRGEFAVLAALAGPSTFDLFARGYIDAHPSRSYTLYAFGAGFADYLDAARPAGRADSLEAIPAALARIERARSEIHRAKGIENAPPPPDMGIDPFVAAMLVRYWRPDSVRLLALPFDFTETLAAHARGEDPPLPLVQPWCVAVARAHYRVNLFPLEDWQRDWLAGLPEEAGDAVPLPHSDSRLASWISTAVSRGLVAAI